MNRLNNVGGDEYSDRLLSYLKHNLSANILEFKQIRKQVYFVKLHDGFPFIIKGFSSRKNLVLQDALTSSLKRNGFPFTYQFYGDKPNLYFESTYYGCLEYIEPSGMPFLYNSQENCQEGLSLLEKFHYSSEKLVGVYKRILPTYDLQNKWHERLQLFLNNLNVLSLFIPNEIIAELISWGEWSLAGLEREKETLFQQPLVVLHGDVAHHNFIRAIDRQLYLIDFDLISIGPMMADYLQYANRILPFLNWSLQDLASYSPIQSYFQHKLFLYALAFPTDLFREWNRLIREKTYCDSSKIHAVLKMTLDQFENRRDFIHDIRSIVK